MTEVTFDQLDVSELSSAEMEMVDGAGFWKEVRDFVGGVIEGWTLAH